MCVHLKRVRKCKKDTHGLRGAEQLKEPSSTINVTYIDA